ncbi:MAG: tetratricopeptide repeat protein [Cyclobacteriaceae bacterium]
MKTSFLAFALILIAQAIYSQEKTFVKEYTYKASEADSKVSCRAIAINQLRSMLLNDLGVYVESTDMLKNSDVGGKNSQDFAENISTISAGITKLNVLDETWNGETYWMKAAISVDTTTIAESLKRISEDRQKVRELEELKQKLNDTNQKMAELQAELATQKEMNSKVAITEKYNANVNEISATNYMYSAKAKFETKDYSGAISDFTDVLKLNPKSILAYAYRGHAKMNLKNYQGAIDDFNKAIELNPRFDAAYVDRGHAKNLLGNYNGAIDDYTNAIQISPSYAYAYTSRGESKIKLKEYQSSIDDFTKAIQFDKNYAMAYLNRGIAKNWLGQKGCTDWNKAAQLDCEPAFELIKRFCK